MEIKGISGISTDQQLKQYIISNGCYSTEENLRIYEKWFAKAPRYIFRAVDRKYRITDKIICDIGCAYGMNLPYCKPGSYGINFNNRQIEYARSLEFRIYNRDINNDDLSDLPKVEVIWCSAVLEHLYSPYLSLCKFYDLLKEKGLLVLYVPTIPLIPQLKHLPCVGKYFYGHLSSDHTNAFTHETVQFTCERAGFKTLEVSPFYPSVLSILNHLPILKKIIDGSVYVGIKT